MKPRIKHNIAIAMLCCSLTSPAQTGSLRGQACGWLTTHHEKALPSQLGLRYIPELTIEQKFARDCGVEMDVSVNNYAIENLAKDQHPDYQGKIKPYRAWFRFSTNRAECRVGLQKINFGPATLLRALMWFDRIDPRDPLQITDGVYGLLGRYYFLNNANIWLWGLYGNNETKGWEFAPTRKKSIEYGARAQIPLWTGELAATYHHREADFNNIPQLSIHPGTSPVPENRFALDGKWNIGIGAWFEAVVIHRQCDIPAFKYQRLWTAGADYTFEIGNGLTALAEYFRIDNPARPFASANGSSFSALSMNYPIGLLDRVSGILFYDQANNDWYRLMTWQRTYDNWIFYLLGFWNPQQIQLYRSAESHNPFSGSGIQFMIVFNH